MRMTYSRKLSQVLMREKKSSLKDRRGVWSITTDSAGLPTNHATVVALVQFPEREL
jgi:hypothetical protein